MKTKLMIAAFMVAAGPALAGGWVDAEVREAAEGPEWKAPTAVASMPKPETSDPMPMGVVDYRQPTMADLASEVANWEGDKERHGHKVELDDKVWNASPTKTVTIELGQPVDKPNLKGLVHDMADKAPRAVDVVEERGGDVGYGPILRIHHSDFVRHDVHTHGEHHHGHSHHHARERHEGDEGRSGELVEIDVDLRGSGRTWTGSAR